MGKQLVVKPGVCIGCRSCELACSYGHIGGYSPYNACLKVFNNEDDKYTVPVMCMHCDNPACAQVCPVEAIVKGEDGTVVHYEERCIHCGNCIKSCPYGNVKFKEGTKTIIKCDACGGDPRCVKICPVLAIDYTETMEESTEVIGASVFSNIREV